MGRTFDAVADLVSPGAVPTHAFRVVYFISEEGEEEYRLAHEGRANMSEWLGNLELLKEDFIAELRGDRIEPREMEEED